MSSEAKLQLRRSNHLTAGRLVCTACALRSITFLKADTNVRASRSVRTGRPRSQQIRSLNKQMKNDEWKMICLLPQAASLLTSIRPHQLSLKHNVPFHRFQSFGFSRAGFQRQLAVKRINPEIVMMRS